MPDVLLLLRPIIILGWQELGGAAQRGPGGLSAASKYLGLGVNPLSDLLNTYLLLATHIHGGHIWGWWWNRAAVCYNRTDKDLSVDRSKEIHSLLFIISSGRYECV